MRGELEQEIEEVRRELLGRLAELEPLPETLQRLELQLQEAQNRERKLERRSVELSTTLTDLRLKVTAILCMDLELNWNNARVQEVTQSLSLIIFEIRHSIYQHSIFIFHLAL